MSALQKRPGVDLRAAPKPRNMAEFAALTKWYFGAPLDLRCLSISGEYGSYEIKQSYNDYHGKGWLFSEHCIKGYDYSQALWAHVFGPLECGGIARASYGQFTIVGGHREKLRLENLRNSWIGKNAGRVRKGLARLALGIGEGESAGIGRSRTLTSGRVDAADAAASSEDRSLHGEGGRS